VVFLDLPITFLTNKNINNNNKKKQQKNTQQQQQPNKTKYKKKYKQKYINLFCKPHSAQCSPTSGPAQADIRPSASRHSAQRSPPLLIKKK